MTDAPKQERPLHPREVLRCLPFARLEQIAQHFRLSLPAGSGWDVAEALVLHEPKVHAVALLYQLSRRELDAICRRMDVGDEGATQDVLARLIPLCEPSV